MKRVTIKLNGTLTYYAERTFEIEVSDGETLSTVSLETLHELADFDQVPWSFSESGELEPTDFTVEACQDAPFSPTENRGIA